MLRHYETGCGDGGREVHRVIEFAELGTTVDIIEALDIIFFDIITVLNFNDLKKLSPGFSRRCFVLMGI